MVDFNIPPQPHAECELCKQIEDKTQNIMMAMGQILDDEDILTALYAVSFLLKNTIDQAEIADSKMPIPIKLVQMNLPAFIEFVQIGLIQQVHEESGTNHFSEDGDS